MNSIVKQEQSIWHRTIEEEDELRTKELYINNGVPYTFHPLCKLDAIKNRDEYEEQLHKVIDRCHELDRCTYKDLHQASFNVVYELGLVWGDEVTRLIIKDYILKLLSYKDLDELPKNIDHHYLTDFIPNCYLGIIFKVVRYRASLNLLDTEVKLYKMPYIIYKEGEPYLIVDTPDKIRERLKELGIEIKDE